MNFWAGVKRMLRIGFGILVGLSMTIVVLVGLHWAWTSWQNRNLEQEISVTKTWPDTTLSVPSLKVEVKTRCSTSVLYYLVRFRPDNNEGVAQTPDTKQTADAGRAAVIERFRQETEKVTLRYKDEFRVLSHEIPLAEFTRLYSKSKGRVDGLEANGTAVCDGENYARANTLKVGWKVRR